MKRSATLLCCFALAACARGLSWPEEEAGGHLKIGSEKAYALLERRFEQASKVPLVSRADEASLRAVTIPRGATLTDLRWISERVAMASARSGRGELLTEYFVVFEKVDDLWRVAHYYVIAQA